MSVASLLFLSAIPRARRLLALTGMLSLLAGCQLETTTTQGGVLRVSVPPKAECPPDHGSTCGDYASSAVVEVIATADPGYEFVGWAGDCTGMGFCQVKMNRHRFVQARFVKAEEAVLHDTTPDLDALLEHGQLPGSCDRWAQAPAAASPYLEKMCGKWMFLYGGFNIMGIPAVIAEFMVKYLPDTVGPGFARFGMIPDPFSATGLPLGLAPGATVGGVKTLSFTCASCHLSATPDGRYSVGLPNHQYDYGKQIMALNYLPTAVLPASMRDKLVAPETQAFLQPMLQELDSKQLGGKLTLSLMKLMGIAFSGTPIPSVSQDTQRQYLGWKTGTQDFVVAPVGAEDHVHTVSKMQVLWNLDSAAEAQAAGAPHAMLGMTGDTPDLDTFLAGFVALSQGSFPLAHLQPLQTYLMSLKAPAPASLPDPLLVNAGRTLFAERGCNDCHNGPQYSGTRFFSYEEIGTDAAMRRWADANLDGVSDVPLVLNAPLNNALKAPRLVGLWAQQRFLHNGSVDTLEQLFCVDHERPTRTDEPFGDQGHRQTCDGLAAGEKQALIAFLRTL